MYDDFDEYDESRVAYVTEDEMLDDEQEAHKSTDKRGARCMCCDIREGMFINGLLILGMTVSSYFLISYFVAFERNIIAFMVGSNIKISSAYIMWSTGLIASLVSLVCPLATHPYGRKQFAYLNLACTIVFFLSVVHHGWSAGNMAMINAPDLLRKYLYKTRRNNEKDEATEKIAKLTFQVVIALAFNALFNSTGALDKRDILALPFMVSSGFGVCVLCIFPAGFIAGMLVFAAIYAADSNKKAVLFKANKRRGLLLGADGRTRNSLDSLP